MFDTCSGLAIPACNFRSTEDAEHGLRHLSVRYSSNLPVHITASTNEDASQLRVGKCASVTGMPESSQQQRSSQQFDRLMQASCMRNQEQCGHGVASVGT